MSSTKAKTAWKIISALIGVAFVALAGWVILNRQFVIDQLTVWSYAPSSAIATIEERSEFTDKGRFYFYTSQPVVATQEDFNRHCPRQEVGSPILGCYTGTGQNYIYDITNERLDGIEEVTAVHEMLHAAWYRLSADEQATITNQLEAAYQKITDQELQDRMAYYERTEPGEYVNELHSILGTEIADLGPELEAYYESYFDRATVLGLHEKYDSVYKELDGRADELYALMGELSVSIESRLTAYDTSSAQLTADISAFNERASAGQFSSMAQFNNERNALINRSDQLKSERLSINADVERYNGYRNEYQNIASQIELLNQSIDSFQTIEQTPSL
jgi:hypothetical protein